MRGEKSLSVPPDVAVAGSSPHARGKVGLMRKRRLTYRIIPACAGKSFILDEVPEFIQDHPRMRGEKTDGTKMDSDIVGSSPHARGKENYTCP